MAERLTEKCSFGSYVVKDYADKGDTIEKVKNHEIIDKLGKLEDILEKYNIDSVEELDKKIDDFTNFMKGNKFETIEDLQNALNGKFIEVFDEKNKIWQDMVKNLTKTEQDRDTWHKACEFLAYKYAEEYFDGRDIEHCFNADKRDKFVKENINCFYQQAKKEKENGTK